MRMKLRRELYMLPRGEQRGLILLSFILLISLAIRIGVQFLPGREPAGVEEFEKEYGALMLAIARSDSIANVASRSNAVTNPRSPFPNPRSPFPNPQSPVNINRADSAQLLPLPGIGPVFAGRIIKYRKLLGGFVRVEQLGEVYGLKQETLDLIRDLIVIDTVPVRKICMDSASFGELLRHPYLDLEQVKALIAYRDFKKDIRSLDELRENLILEDSCIERLSPYFDLGK